MKSKLESFFEASQKPVGVEYFDEGEEDSAEEKEPDEIEYIQWQKIGKRYYPIGKIETRKKAKPGVYDIGYDRSKNSFYILYKELFLDELFTFPDPIQDKIINDIKIFWDRKEQFKKYKYAYKRGILLYGSAGNGKSSIINLLSKELVENHKGVIFFLNTPNDLEPYIQFVQNIFKQIQDDTKIICVIEDIEAFTRNSETEGRLLNLLDGMNRMENIVTIASTNYPEELKERLLNRPSRFDRRYEIKNPNAKIREAYFKHKLKADDLKVIDVKQWVKETKGLTISHLGEIVKSVCALGNTFDEVVKELKQMKIKISSFDFNKHSEEEDDGSFIEDKISTSEIGFKMKKY